MKDLIINISLGLFVIACLAILMSGIFFLISKHPCIVLGFFIVLFGLPIVHEMGKALRE